MTFFIYIYILLRVLILLSALIFLNTTVDFISIFKFFPEALNYCDAPKDWEFYFQSDSNLQREILIELYSNATYYLNVLHYNITYYLKVLYHNTLNYLYILDNNPILYVALFFSFIFSFGLLFLFKAYKMNMEYHIFKFIFIKTGPGKIILISIVYIFFNLIIIPAIENIDAYLSMLSISDLLNPIPGCADAGPGPDSVSGSGSGSGAGSGSGSATGSNVATSQTVLAKIEGQAQHSVPSVRRSVYSNLWPQQFVLTDADADILHSDLLSKDRGYKLRRLQMTTFYRSNLDDGPVTGGLQNRMFAHGKVDAILPTLQLIRDLRSN